MLRVLGGAKVDSHEEFLRCAIGELLQVEDVQAVLREDAGDGVDDAWLVGTGEGQDVVVGHLGEERGRRVHGGGKGSPECQWPGR